VKYLPSLALLLCPFAAQAVSIDAVYFGQTHVLKPDSPYFGLVGERNTLIKVHVTDPATPASPAVSATLSLGGQSLVVPLTGPATLPASIPDGPGVVQHSNANSFTATLPAAWIKKGLQVTVNAGPDSTTITDMKVSAPTKVVMTMTDVHYFAKTTGDYSSGTFAEVEAKWPVTDLEVRRLRDVVFRELVIPPRSDAGTQAVRIRSKAEYYVQTGLSFDGEQAAALEWNGALKRAAGISGRWSLYYLNVYNAVAGGQAGGFAGVGNGTSRGILHHELGHALSLPHWGDSAAYPYKGDMHGIQAPNNYNETHAGPTWAYDLRTGAYIPPTVQSNNVGGRPAGTYKVDPMQGGGTGYEEPSYLLNHFSDYSVNQMRSYLNSHVVLWNPALSGGNGSWAQWNQTAGAYTTSVSNNGVQFPITRDTQVISILASMSGGKPAVNMVYPPIGPYTAGLIRLFDPSVAADRTAANSIFSPTNGSDYCVRVVQGGVTKTYMLAASALTSASLTSGSSLETEAINLPAADGAVTRIELLSTPNVEDVGLPANPTVFYTWAPLMPARGTFDLPPTAHGSSAVTMAAVPGEVEFGFTGGTVEYLFTETSGNPGGTSSGWQSSRSYTDTGLQPNTTYTYTVSMRAGSLSSPASVASSATTPPLAAPGAITILATEPFSVASGSGYKSVTNLGSFNAAGADKLVVAIALENANNDHAAIQGVRYNGIQMIEALQQTGGTRTGALAIYYLDDPGPVGTGITVSGYNPNGGIGTAYSLTGTKDGFGAINSRSGTNTNSVGLTTTGPNSLVIAALLNSGNPGSSGNPAPSSPLTQTYSGSWGSQWGGFATGHQQVAAISSITPTFSTTTGSSYSISVATVEFVAETLPLGIWTQTAGGSRSWNTASNWNNNTVPSPGFGQTLDFSTVNLAADTTLDLAANRTGGIWRFGDTTGSENWIVSEGNTLTLAGATPGIEVVNNTTTLDCIVAGTSGLAKTGAGTLVLTGSNTYTGGTSLTDGSLAIHHPNAIGTGSLTIGSASNPILRNDSGAAITLPNNPMVWTGNWRHSGNGLDFGTGNVSITSNSTQEITSGTLSLGGVVSGGFGINKQGSGTLVLNGLNTYTGSTILRQGSIHINTLRNYGASSSLGAPASGNIVIAATNSSTLNYTGSGDSTNRTIQIGPSSSAGVTATVSNNGTGPLIFTATAFNAPIGITTGSAPRTLALGGSFGDAVTPNEIRGVIADNTLNGATAPANRVSLTKTGAGTWRLFAANTYTGNTTISAGTLLVPSNLITTSPLITIGDSATLQSTGGFTLAANQSINGTGASGSVTTTSSTGLITNGGSTLSSLGTLTLTRLSILGAGNEITAGDLQSGGAGSFQRGLVVGNNGVGVLSLTGGSLTSNGGSTNADVIGSAASVGDGTFIIDGGSYINTANTGTLSLGNGQASGTLTLTSGSATLHTLRFHAGNSGTKTSAIVNFDGGTLTVSNITVSTGLTKQFNFNGGQFIASANLPAFSGVTLNVGNGGAKIDTNGFSFTLADPLLNSGGTSTGGLRKSGAGTLTLAGSNSYAGTTEVVAGTLALGANHVLPDSPLALGHATLDTGIRSDSTGPLALSGTATIQFGSGATLAFADSRAADWSAGSLSLTGDFVSGSSLRFGNSANGLTSAQLAKISAAGFAGFTLDRNGYLIGLLPNSFTFWQAANGTTGGINLDHDNDGVPNGIEYFLGGNSNTTGFTALPDIANDAGSLSVIWTKSASYPGSYPADFVVESSPSVEGPWTEETLGGRVTITGNEVTYTFPSPLGSRRFVRLRVNGP
jgi:autotransporter-associated beta strand protein